MGGFGYNAVHGGAAPTRTKRVFLRAGTAYHGFAVCYKFDAAGVTAENDAITSSMYGRAVGTAIDDWCDARRVMVELPDYKNGIHFAGVVAKESHEVVGPNWITVHLPGSVCEIYAMASAGAGITACDPRNSTDTSIAGPRMLTYTISCGSARHSDESGTVPNISSYNGMFVYAGFPGEGSVRPMQAITGDLGKDTAWDASNLVMAELMVGPPSGGVQLVAFGSSVSSCVVTSDTAHDWGNILTPFGLSVISLSGTKPSATAGAIISLGAGKFIGQKKAFFVAGIGAGTAPALQATRFTLGCNTAAAVRGGAVTSVLCFGSVADACVIEWNGYSWHFLGGTTSILTGPTVG